eukprot:scaffold65688_cov50-Phaeocystis_antarctica.AAC.5
MAPLSLWSASNRSPDADLSGARSTPRRPHTPTARHRRLRPTPTCVAKHRRSLPHAGFRPPPGTWNLEPRRNLYAS